MGELIVLSEWKAKKEEEELNQLARELSEIIAEQGITVDHFIFDSNGEPFKIMSTPASDMFTY